MSVGLIGTLCRSKPVAFLTAEATAAVDEIAGGSPTPFAPKGALGSGCSIRAAISTGGMSREVGNK